MIPLDQGRCSCALVSQCQSHGWNVGAIPAKEKKAPGLSGGGNPGPGVGAQKTGKILRLLTKANEKPNEGAR